MKTCQGTLEVKDTNYEILQFCLKGICDYLDVFNKLRVLELSMFNKYQYVSI